MKKFANTKKSAIVAFLVGLFAVSCGLQISKVEFNKTTLEVGKVLTMTTTFNRYEDYQNNTGITLYYAVRVPSDWTVETMLTVVDKESTLGLEQTFTFENSEAYAKLMELSFPRTGYKWIAFQTPDTIAAIQGDPAVATVSFRTAGAVGKYNLDIICGGSTVSPSDILSADGTINKDKVFNHEYTYNGTKVASFAEYLVNASTITASEVSTRSTALASYSYNGLPMSPADVGNNFNLDSSFATVDLNIELTATTGIDEVETDGATEKATYYNLKGVEERNPSNGLYIKKQGNKAEKVVVK